MKRIFLIATVVLTTGLFACKTKQKAMKETKPELVAEQNEKDTFEMEFEESEAELIEDAFEISTTVIGADSIRFERTSCFGTCPVFRVTFYPNGTMKYSGRVFVDNVGTYTANFKKEYLAEALELMQVNGFTKMEDSYDSPMTDVPSAITEYWFGETYKKVVDRVGGPEGLKSIEKHLDFIVSKATEWNKIED